MDRNQLLGYYTSRPLVVSIAAKLQEPVANHLQIGGLAGSADAIILAAVTSLTTNSHLVILNDREEAAYFLNNIENLLANNQPLFFPSSYKRTFQLDDSDNASILSRAEVLSRLNKASSVIVVTYPEAIAERVVTRKNLEQNSITLRVGEKLSTDFLNEFLLHHEFDL